MDMKQTLNIALLGKTGNGKSSTGNTLLHRKAFPVSYDKASCTKHAVLEVSDVQGVRLRVVDTPGIKDTDVTNDVTVWNVCNAMSLCPEGFDALVLVLDYNNLFSKEELETLNILKKAFGESFIREYCVVIVTHGDNFDLDRSEEHMPIAFKDWCKELKQPPDLVQLFRECQYKVLLFYNKGPKYEGQRKASVTELLDLLLKKNGRYTNEHFVHCASEREHFISESLIPELRNDIQERLSLLMSDVDDILTNMHSDKKIDLTKLKHSCVELTAHLEKQFESSGPMDDLKTKVDIIKQRIENIETVHNDKEELRLLRQEIQTLKDPKVNWGNLFHRFLVIMTSILRAAGVVVQIKPDWTTLGNALNTAGDFTEKAVETFQGKK